MPQGVSTKSDGGYYAIKGFAFQFDATILEAFNSPDSIVNIEGDQDIETEDYYIQVKHHSTTFTLSRISNPVKQILDQFSQNTDRRYRLFCHFSGSESGTVLQLTGQDLERTLGPDAEKYSTEVCKLFLDRFEIKFAADFESQFGQVLGALRFQYHLKTDDEAIVYHAIIHHHLTSLVTSRPLGSRTTSSRQLAEVVRTSGQKIFQGAYRQHLGRKKYIDLIKSRMMPPGPKSVNVPRRERLLVVEVNPDSHVQDIVDVAMAASDRFHIRSNSPQPFLLFRGIFDAAEIKRALWDADLKFRDGTNFNGDRFRIDDLIGNINQIYQLRLIDENRLVELTSRVQFQEVFDFYSTKPLQVEFGISRLCQIDIETVAEATEIMGVVRKR